MKEIIKLEKITKEYNHKLILDQVDLSIYEGQSMVFTGHNGSGKSTLLKIISGLVKPSSGKVVYRQKDVKNCSRIFSLQTWSIYL